MRLLRLLRFSQPYPMWELGYTLLTYISRVRTSCKKPQEPR